MSLTRSMLKGMNLTDEQVSAIIDEHTDTIEGLKKARDGYKKDADRLPAIQKELEDLKASIENNSSVAKSEYDKVVKERDDLKSEFDTYKNDQATKETERLKRDAYKKLLKDAGVGEKHLDSILKISDINKLEFGDDGNVKDSDKVIEGMKSEWSDFIPTTKTIGAGTETPPANVGGDAKAPSKATLMTRKYRENLYGVAKEV